MSQLQGYGMLLGSSIDLDSFNKARKRWRMAYTAIKFMLTLSKLDDNEEDSLPPTLTASATSIRRWRLAYNTIYSSRALLSLVREIIVVDESADPLISPCKHEFKIGIEDEDSPGFGFASEVDKGVLANLVKDKNAKEIRRLGGVAGLARALNSDRENGIHGNEEDISSRKAAFGSNSYPKPPPKGLFHFVMEAFKDHTILILLVCAALSLGFGIKEHGIGEGWYEGGSIFVAVFLVVVVSSLSNLRQERQFYKLSKISDNIQVEVVRNGRRQKISIFDIVVGDIVCLSLGNQIPADGLFLEGHSLQVDESSMTGESDHVEVNGAEFPFLLSGSKIVDGYARMIVTSVGLNTSWGNMMSSITSQSTNDETPLQARLNKLTAMIGKIGLSVALLVLVVLFIRYFTGNTVDKNGNREFFRGRTGLGEVFNSVVRIVAVAVTIVVVAIPEGLPLAVTLTLAYSMKRMMADQAMVRKLSACETMGSATVICTDKTGTLTMNQMKITKFWLGIDKIEHKTSIPPLVLKLLHQGVGFNTTGNVDKSVSSADSTPQISGSPTEKAILNWAVFELDMDVEQLKKSCNIVHVETFNSTKKRSGVLVTDDANSLHAHWKGAAEMVLGMCTTYYDRTGLVRAIDAETRNQLERIIEGMAASSLRCIAFAHKKTRWEESKRLIDGRVQHRLEEDGCTLLGIVGMKDPCRPRSKEAIEACRLAGVEIKMITGDNVFTAKAIATECGILGPNNHQEGEVVEGAEFRNYTPEERMEKVDKIRVMARSTPMDKLLMVQCLRLKQHVVAVTGDGTNDAPALKEADIGLSMGIQGTEVAKEELDIVILDDDFGSVATVLRWGRCVYNNIQKFIQFQLTVNVAALVINFIAAVSSGDVPLTTVQLLWVNLIMDTLGALALATDRPTKELMNNPPVGRFEPLITNVMWRNLLAQAFYQIAVLLTLQFRGRAIFGVSTAIKDTLIFNTFVLCQVFNEFNSRKLEKQNVFAGLHKNRLFMGVVGVTIVLQIVMVEFLKKFADTTSLNWWQWLVCIGIASLSWPISWVVKLVPVPKKPIFAKKNN